MLFINNRMTQPFCFVVNEKDEIVDKRGKEECIDRVFTIILINRS